MNAYIKKPNFPWQKIIISLVILISIIGILNVFGAPVKNTFYYATAPISQALWKAGNGTSEFFGSFFRVRFLSSENNDLKNENQRLLAEIVGLQETVKERQNIKEALLNTQEDNFKLVLAETVGLEGDFILLNKGSSDGILENMPVISAQKVLFGKIDKVYENFSKVMLISSSNSVVDTRTESMDMQKITASGAIKGRGNLSIYLDLVASDAQIDAEDNLITSGQEGVFPRGLLIGKIVSVSKNDLKPFQTAEVLPFFDIKNVDNLFIITNYIKTK